MTNSAHDALIKLQKALECTVITSNGMCFGITMKWLEASLLSKADMERFEKRIERIRTTSTNELIIELNAVKEKIKLTQTITEQERSELLEIPALLDSIQIYQNPDLYNSIFNQSFISQYDIERTSFFGSSSAIQELGNLTIIHSESMMFSQETFIAYLSDIQSVFDTEKTNASILLCTYNHAIGLYFNEKQWVFMDINRWPARKAITKLENISAELLSRVGENNPFELSIIRPINQKIGYEMKMKLEKLREQNITNVRNSGLAKTVGSLGINHLFIAAAKKNQAMVNILLEQGADPNQASSDNGITPLFIAAYNGHLEIVEQLLEYGAHPNQASTDNGTTPLSIAVQNGHVEIVEQLLGHGAQPNQVSTDNGITPLSIAVQNGHVEIVEKLLGHGAQPNQSSTDLSITPLYIAAQKGYLEIVEELLKRGANPVIENKAGLSVLNWALTKNETDVIKVIFLKTLDDLLTYGINADENVTNLKIFEKLAPYLSPALMSDGLKIILAQGQCDIAKFFCQKLPNNTKICESVEKIILIYEHIDKLRDYAKKLQITDQKIADETNSLADQLKQSTQDFVRYVLISPNRTEKNRAQQNFQKALNEAYDSMKTHQHKWKYILANIAIATTGIGLLAVIGKVLSTGNVFFQRIRSTKTNQNCSQKV